MTVRIITGDCRQVLPTLQEASVHCVTTSPPYWGLRSYLPDDDPDKPLEIGSEPTLDEWVQTLVGVFRQVRRVLRDDGTLWLNLGDSYAGSWGAQSREHAGKHAPNVSAISANQIKAAQIRASGTGSLARTPGLKPKDLIGQPWRLAFALQADGWYLRQDIVWHKPNPMPESVRDRCTKAHEYIFLLSKREQYYFDARAMQEPAAATNAHDATGRTKQRTAGNVRPAKGQAAYEAGDDLHRSKAGLLAYAQRSRRDSFKREDSKRAQVIPGQSVGTHRADRDESAYDTLIRNKRSVWTVATRPFSGAHFATFPPALVEPCIAAGCPLGGTVLDPFGGAGTVGMVADAMQRHAVLIELGRQSVDIADRRIRGDAPLFAEVLTA